MVNNHVPYIPLALGDVMRGRTGAAAAAAAQSEPGFEDQLLRAVSTSLETMGPGGGKFRVRIEEDGQGSAVGGGLRQYVVTVDPMSPGPRTVPAAGAATGMIPASGPMGSDTLNRHFSEFPDPLPALREALTSLGVDPNSVELELYDDVVANWGGHYTNHLIRANVNGKVEEYSLEWTLRNPMVTAVDIRRLATGRFV